MPIFAKCCRYNGLPVIWIDKLANTQRFTLVLDNEAVLDHETGLTWERTPDHTTTKNWQEAIQYCYGKTIGGRKGWRLPTVEELLSLIDPSQSGPALPAGHPFIGVSSYDYLTATTAVLNNAMQTDIVVTVGIGNGHWDHENKAQGGFVWCVRGGKGLF